MHVHWWGESGYVYSSEQLNNGTLNRLQNSFFTRYLVLQLIQRYMHKNIGELFISANEGFKMKLAALAQNEHFSQ